MSQEENRPSSYVVVSRKDYENLYNRQYAQLTSLKKKLDPVEKKEAFFETTLKTHYPKVYQDMIRNDYIMTRPAIRRVAQSLIGDSEKREQLQMTMQRQLQDVVSGRQKRVKLSNPLYFFTQRYLNRLVKDSSVSKNKRQLLYHHLYNYAKNLPVYINRPLRKVEQAMQNTARDIDTATNPPILVNDGPDDPGNRKRRLKEEHQQLREDMRRKNREIVQMLREAREIKKETSDPSWMDRLRKHQIIKKHPRKKR